MTTETRTPAERLAAYRSKHVIRDHLDTSDGLHCGLDGLRVIPKWDHKLRHDPSEIHRLVKAVEAAPPGWTNHSAITGDGLAGWTYRSEIDGDGLAEAKAREWQQDHGGYVVVADEAPE